MGSCQNLGTVPHYSVSGSSFGQPYSSVGKLGRRTGSGPDMNADMPNQAEHDLAVTRLLRSGGAVRAWSGSGVLPERMKGNRRRLPIYIQDITSHDQRAVSNPTPAPRYQCSQYGLLRVPQAVDVAVVLATCGPRSQIWMNWRRIPGE